MWLDERDRRMKGSAFGAKWKRDPELKQAVQIEVCKK
jgi:hypothetical protein